MTSKRESIMARMAVDMAAITVIAGYHTTVKTVVRWVKAPPIDNLDFDSFPLVIVEEGDEVSEYQPGSQAMTTISFNVNAYLTGGASPLSPTTLNAFIEDIKKKIESDHTMNGNAVDTIPIQTQVSVGETLPNYGMATLRIASQYYHGVATP